MTKHSDYISPMRAAPHTYDGPDPFARDGTWPVGALTDAFAGGGVKIGDYLAYACVLPEIRPRELFKPKKYECREIKDP